MTTTKPPTTSVLHSDEQPVRPAVHSNRPLCLGVLGAGFLLLCTPLALRSAPESFTSTGSLIVSIKLSIPQGSPEQEEFSNFIATQAALMQSGLIVNRALASLRAQKPDLAATPVKLNVTVQPKTTIFLLSATGGSPDYTQAYLQACMEEYKKYIAPTKNMSVKAATPPDHITILEKASQARPKSQSHTPIASRSAPETFISTARILVTIKPASPDGMVAPEELGDFIGTQAARMQSGFVVNRAQARLRSKNPALAATPVKLDVTVEPKTTIFLLSATGESPDYTQAFLQACTEEYILLSKQMSAIKETTLEPVTIIEKASQARPQSQ